MHGPTLPFAPTKTYGLVSINLREKWNPFFFFLSLVRFSLLFLSPSFLSFLLFFSSLSTRTSFICLLSSFLLIFSLFHFLFSFFFFFSFSYPFLLLLPVLIKSGGNFPPTFLPCHLSSLQFFLFFFHSLSYT